MTALVMHWYPLCTMPVQWVDAVQSAILRYCGRCGARVRYWLRMCTTAYTCHAHELMPEACGTRAYTVLSPEFGF